jgi:hypothetical protein
MLACYPNQKHYLYWRYRPVGEPVVPPFAQLQPPMIAGLPLTTSVGGFLVGVPITTRSHSLAQAAVYCGCWKQYHGSPGRLHGIAFYARQSR